MLLAACCLRGSRLTYGWMSASAITAPWMSRPSGPSARTRPGRPAVNPLLPAVQRQLARAAEQNGNDPVAIQGLRATLILSSFDKVDAHYRLACLLQRAGELPSAKRHLLMALEEAPRFRQGHQKLLEIVKSMETRGGAEPQEPKQ